MRKHSVRKWLHAILDLLPIFLIPVFMIYSHRHTLTDVTTVDVQYKYQSNDVNSTDDLIEGNIYHFYIDNDILNNYFSSDTEISLKVLKCQNYDFTNLNLSIDDVVPIINNDDFTDIEIELNFSNDYNYLNFYLVDIEYLYSFDINSPLTDHFSIDCICVLTYLNEPTIPLLDLFEYTDYNEIESVQVDDSTSSITDVFMDNFTHTVNTKFNFSSAFNFNDLWHWLDTNLFGAQNSQVMYAIYNIVVYEFLMDVLFIIYCLFMFIVDFAESCLDRPFNVTKRGR